MSNGNNTSSETIADTFKYKLPFYIAGVIVGLLLVRFAFVFVAPVVCGL